MTPEQILALIAALAGEPDPDAFAGLRSGGVNPNYPVEIVACERPVAPTEIEGETVICGRVAVPLDHDSPDSGKIHIAFNIYRAHSLAPEPDPVMFLHGGPGDGTVSRVGRTGEIFAHLRGQRDIVAIDERGVDSSAPEMDCYQTLASELDTVVAARSGNAPPPLPGDFITACLDELTARGIDYTHINTYQNARDIPAVLSALGYETYNLYGGSYGSKLAMEVIRQAPPGIRSAVIDGVAPPWLPLYSSFWESHSSHIEISLAPCERDPICAAAYPDIVERTFALFETLAETPVEGPVELVTADALLGLFEARNRPGGAFVGLTSYMPLVVTQLEAGDTTLYDLALAEQLIPRMDNATVRSAALANGLSDAEMAQVEAMLAAAEHIRIANDTITVAARALEAERDAVAADVDLAVLFDERLAAAIRAMPEAPDRIAAGRDYLNLRFSDPSTAALVELIRKHFDDATANQLASLVLELSENEIVRVFELVRADNAGTMANLEGQFQLFLYACQEDFVGGFNSAERFRSTMAADGAWGPRMQDMLMGWYNYFFETCPLFEPQPRDNWPLRFATDLPVLAMNGEVDMQTAPVWGERAIKQFSNARNVIIPEAGHGTILYSQCARDITAAFIEDPESDLDTSCVEDERLPVMLPDGTMHSLPY